MNLVHLNFIIFISVVFLTVIILSVYKSVAPEETIPYNFSPFPKSTPSALPDPARPNDNCFDKLVPCNELGECSSCSSLEYACVDVKETDAKRKINGITVPVGRWCLPKDTNPNPQCNQYTGRWLWTEDPEYCASIGSKNTQCWKCECLYPSLFSDSSQGCITNISCQNTSPLNKSAILGQPANKLVGAPGTKFAGQPWDPTAEVSNTILQYTPYDKDKNGNPLFVCSCNDTSGGQFFTELPGDPQNCHLEPCYKYTGFNSEGLECSDGKCSCNCSQTNMAKSSSGTFKGTCVPISDACGSFAYDEKTSSCVCGGGPFWERKCKSAVTGVNMDQQNLPNCQEPQNALGSECVNPCEAVTCFNGAPCISCASNSTFPECSIYFSDTIPDGKEPAGVCDCLLAKLPDGNNGNYGGYYGPACAQKCLADGTVLRQHKFGSVTGSASCGCCCSLQERVSGNFIKIAYNMVCAGTGDQRATKGNPPLPQCKISAQECADPNLD